MLHPRLSFGILLATLAAFPLVRVAAQDAGTAPDYTHASSWVCRPDKKEACADNLDASAVHGDGRLSAEPYRANPQPPIDCFYIYPTVSNDRRPNSDLQAQRGEELLVVREQFQRFGSQCRLFAPLYRQRTLPSLRAEVPQGDNRMAYGDVKSAWQYYLSNAGAGRGVVLIGHSQGADLLKKLIQEEIDGKPLQSRLVSAILLGTPVAVPIGKDVGGDFKTIAACRASGQIGCVVSYASFRKTMPPPTGSWYGRNPSGGMMAICSNPAALGGGSGALKPYFATDVRRSSGNPNDEKTGAWLAGGARIPTPFVTLPGLLTAQCVQDQRVSYLEINVHADANGPRTSEIGGDIYQNGRILPQWGLHRIDMHLAIGNLVEMVGNQAKTYVKR